MENNFQFQVRTALATGLRELLEKLENRLALTDPLQIYLAGGMAVHLYTAARVTTDVDAEFAGRVMIPNDLAVEVSLEDGTNEIVYLDTNYNPTFALMHEDYQTDSWPVDLGLSHIKVNVLSPVDLAVSKIARLADNDRDDIDTLVRLGLTNAAEIEARANEAIIGYVGGMGMLKANLRDALAIARAAEGPLSHAPTQTLAEQWRAEPGKGERLGRVTAISDTEVIQHVGQGKHVAWDRQKLKDNVVVGESVTINESGEVTRARAPENGLGL
ncbi:DUF6036 family nucleotidyltransferase [Ralstonia pseudosolanacearum]|uniref:DUF6036 family nucleotidyltransferase n=1 Tax=Ralstonia pseudosolanacearum TaxID=1310165 RepID=UPI001FFA8322|nr:DUF6036 family nucleotidyltransferase [Ralstonia pseudosolanacearum]